MGERAGRHFKLVVFEGCVAQSVSEFVEGIEPGGVRVRTDTVTVLVIVWEEVVWIARVSERTGSKKSVFTLKQ